MSPSEALLQSAWRKFLLLRVPPHSIPAPVLRRSAGHNEHLRCVVDATPVVDESLRSRRPSVFSVLRALLAAFHSDDDPHLGLYGAFGYDLAFQFDPVELIIPRTDDQRDMVL